MTSKNAKTALSFKLLRENPLTSSFQWQASFSSSGQVYKQLSSGDWCASFSAPSRYNDFVKYSLNDVNLKLGLVRKKQHNNFTWTNFYDFEGESIAILHSGANPTLIKQLKLANLSVQLVESTNDVANMVKQGQVDYGIIDNLSYEQLEYKYTLQFSINAILQTETVIFFNKKCKALEPILKEL